MNTKRLILLGLIIAIGFYIYPISSIQAKNKSSIDSKELLNKAEDMKLGAFSMSLSVKDIQASKSFYEKLGFKYLGGNIKQNYLILKNGETVIGLFQGMFPNNVMTFNPGWDQSGQNLDEFDDIRKVQSDLKNKGIDISKEIDKETNGPASFMVTDPDGNVILFDQHR